MRRDDNRRPPVSPLYQRFAASADRRPDALAVDGPGGRWSYQQLRIAADRVLRALRDHGAAPGSVVGLCMDRSANLVAAVLAVAKLGAVYLPLDPRHPADRIGFALADARCELVIADAAGVARIPPGPRTIASPPWPDGSADDAERAERAESLEPAVGHPDGIACVFYTSGSTGRPKGVAVTRGNITSLIDCMAFLGLGPGDRVGHLSTPAFDAATFEIWVALAAGAAVVIVPSPLTADVPALLRFVADFELSTMFLTAALFRVAASTAPGAFAGVRHLLVGGEVLDASSVVAVQRAGGPANLYNAYGPTEATTFATVYRIPPAWDGARTSVPIGAPLSGLSARLLDDRLRPVPPGTVGQLYLAGGSITRGYLGAPGLTAQRFVADPFAGAPGGRMYYTGDLAAMSPDGVLTFAGRRDGQVKIRGNRVELAEIEITLAALPGIAAAAAAVWEPEPGDRRLVAAVVPEDRHVDLAAVRAGLKARLPDFMTPAALATCAELPLNANGKVDRDAVAKMVISELGSTQPDDPDHDGYLAIVSAAWEEVLRHRVDTDANFFDAGGDSLLLLQVHARLEQELGHPIALTDLLEFPTVASLAAALHDQYGPPVR